MQMDDMVPAVLGILDCFRGALQHPDTLSLTLSGWESAPWLSHATVGVPMVQVHTALGKLATSAKNRDVAGAHFREALQSYGAALRAPETLGTLKDRNNIRCAIPALLTGHALCLAAT
jgi:hypothetical protein